MKVANELRALFVLPLMVFGLTLNSLFIPVVTNAETVKPTLEIELLPGVYDGKTRIKYVPLGQLISVKYVPTESYEGKFQTVQATVNLYSDGVLIQTETDSNITADGNLKTVVFDPPVKKGKKDYGPFLVCAYFKDVFGNTTTKAPCSASMWIPIEVPLVLVSNGCGGQTGYKKIDEWEKLLLDKRKLGKTEVDFRPACNVHDAGYSGFTVKQPATGEVVDYLRMPRYMVDTAFLADLTKICNQNFPVGKSDLAASSSCYEWATRYFSAVRMIGKVFYDANPVKFGIQSSYVKPAAGMATGAALAGFARSNG